MTDICIRGDKMSKSKGKNKRISVTVSSQDYQQIENLVKIGRYRNKGDFVNMAIKRLLAEEVGPIEIDKKTLETIKKALGIE